MKQRTCFLISFSLALTTCFAVYGQQSRVTIRPQVKKIIAELRKERIVHLGEGVGLSLIPETDNKYFKFYQKLGKLATNQELLALVNDNSNAIVVYSFSLLHSRNYNGLKDIFLKHLKDTTTFDVASGCTGDTRKINSFMYWKLSPPYSETGRIYMTKEELVKYYEVIRSL